MDSKVVNRDIKSKIWPSLKEEGFGHFTNRNAWRFHNDRIDVVNFQSFNSYNASVIGCTTFSFSVNLGCYLLSVPYHYGQAHIKEKSGYLLPDEAQCHIRGRLHPVIKRTLLDRLLSRKIPHDIWVVREDGSNLEPLITEVQQALLSRGMLWFKQFEQPREVLRILVCEPQQMGERWGFGSNPSPIRSYFVGYAALAIGDYELAIAHLKSALASGCFGAVEKELQTAIQAAAQQSGPADSPPASLPGCR